MWTSRKSVREKEGYLSTVDRGSVTQSGSSSAVFLDGERRGLVVCAPRGYHWTPSQGDDVVVTRSADGEGFVVGATQAESELSPQEIALYTESSGKIHLGEGSIWLSGDIYINDKTLDQYIEEVINPPDPDPVLPPAQSGDGEESEG